MFPPLALTAAEIAAHFAAATRASVRQALAKPARDFFDLLTLISPAAQTLLPEIAAAATVARRRYFGKTVSLYAPLYVSNSCINGCRYCDFNARNLQPRKILTLDEIAREADALRALGLDAVLVVAGENPHRCSTDYLAAAGKLLRPRFSSLALEVAPQTEEGYRQLFAAGFDGLTLFQETYDRELYAELHPSGPKRDYDFRLWSQLRAGRAGMRVLGVAFLMGLTDWRLEAASLAAHAFYLQRECWRSKLQFAFPRLTPMGGGFTAPAPVSDEELALAMSAFRVVFPEAGMTVSTREPPALRDRLVVSCADNMSAGSKVTPGGYAADAREEVGQFTLNDERRVAEIAAAIRRHGQAPVRKNWDAAFNSASGGN
ncbi:MAG: 2-iminoacetate synthase ThiH [Planctomycetota bacterium]|jgi:2-iminoacetate synthase|nr:2-iminoacetate synthase ThiH [Planctomycetota bacterium]